jgi:hypothetical protein
VSSDQVVAGDAAREPTDGFPLGEPAVQRALESIAELERTLGPDHPDTLNARSNLAAAYQAVGRVADAIPLFEYVLVARQRVLGPRDADTLTSQNNLAATYQDAGRHAEAILLFKLTLAARERLLGAGHPSTLNSQADLAGALEADQPEVRAARDDLAAESPPAVAEQQSAEERAAQQESVEGSVPGPLEPPAAPSSDDAAPEPISEPPVAPAAAKLPAAAATVELPAMVLAAETDDQPPPEPAPVPEPEPEARQDVSEPPPLAKEPPTVPAVVEPPAAPAAAESAVEEPPDGEKEPAAAAAAETTAQASPEPEPAPDPEPEPEPELEARQDVSESTPPAEEPPAEQPSAAPSNQRPLPTRDRPARRRRRVLSLVAAIVIVFAGGGVAGLLTRPHAGHHGPAASHGGGSQPLSPAGRLAAVWVAQEVARNAIVACDPLMCSALETRGVLAANLLVLRADTTSPLGAEVVVVTPAVRSEFGSRVSSVYAPSVIAGFGSGAGEVSVRVVAQNGPTAYLTALGQDAADRKTAGAQLLANKHILASAQARAQLAAGAVDSRLLLMLPALAAVHPVQVLAFDPAPGAGPGVPLCSADLSGAGQAAKVSDTTYLRWLTSFVGTQVVPFAGTMSVLQEAGQPVVRVVFAEPSPLGLLAHT